MRVAERSAWAMSYLLDEDDLQWGRNMRVAESRAHHEHHNEHGPSMGPQHESCGKGARWRPGPRLNGAFNGAAT